MSKLWGLGFIGLGLGLRARKLQGLRVSGVRTTRTLGLLGLFFRGLRPLGSTACPGPNPKP